MSSKGKERKMKRKEAGRRWRPGMLSVAVLALIVGALVLTGCGGSSGGGSTEATTTASGSGSGGESSGSSSEGSGAESGSGTQGGPGGFEVSDEQRACLKEKGVELPEFKSGEGSQGGESGEMPEPPEGGQMPENGEAPEGGEMPEGGPPSGGFGGEGNEEMQKAFEECGVEMPEFKGGSGGEGGPNTNSAAFKKQVKEYVACVRENGYELAEPDFSGEGPIFEKAESESSAFKSASKSCEGLLKGGGTESESG
jgi:hypothetical protein